MVTAREQRLAENELVFREVNERIAEIGVRFELENVEAFCECSNTSCTERFEMSRSDYAHVRSSSTQFVVIPGHETPEVERVVEHREGYLVVEKFGEGAAIAQEEDRG